MLKYPEKCQNLTCGQTLKIDLICDYCGNDFTQKWNTRVKSQSKTTPKDACKKCRMKKREETSLKLYGTKVPSQSSESRKKSSKTKGGNGLSVTDYHDQIIEMYSQENTSLKSIADKLKLGRTALRQYMISLGLDITGNPQLKAQKTTQERYGNPHFLQSEAGQTKLKKLLKEKYGSENPYKNEEYKKNHIDKMTKTCLDKYGVEYILQDPNRQEEFEQKRKETRIKNGQLMYDGKNMVELAKERDFALTTFYQLVQQFGLDYAIRSEKHHTNLELIIKNMLDRLDIKYTTGFSVGKRIADFYLPDYKIIIEADGLYWHSDRIIKNYRHHLDRKQAFTDAGFVSLFFREDEILEKRFIIESIILNKVNKSIRIGARECEIKEISKKLGKKFLLDNHLMGIGQGRFFGLLKNGTLYSCICIKINKDGHEISRFCNKKGYSVIGGFSRLIKFASEKLNIVNLSTFVDLRYGSGEYLKNLGFEYIDTHLSFKWTSGHKTCHRLTYLGNSGYDNGFFKIWDCGQAKYTLRVK